MRNVCNEHDTHLKDFVHFGHAVAAAGMELLELPEDGKKHGVLEQWCAQLSAIKKVADEGIESSSSVSYPAW